VQAINFVTSHVVTHLIVKQLENNLEWNEAVWKFYFEECCTSQCIICIMEYEWEV
jgi:hypothetical protein